MQQAKDVSMYVEGTIQRLCAREGDPATRAALAKMRRGIGKAPGSMPEIWEYTLSDLPESLLSRDGKPSQGEWAVHIALTLFAMHQQGLNTVNECMHRPTFGLGKSVAALVHSEDDLSRIKRRFDRAATADTMEEFSNHLRNLIQLMRAEKQPLDYAALAKDLFFYQSSALQDRVRLRWGEDFYAALHRSSKTETEE